MNGPRKWALVLGVLVALCGLVLLHFAAGPMVLILGLLMAITVALEPIYGRASGTPRGPFWRATGERFVDPQTEKLITVWYNTRTGERRYVDEAEGKPPTT
ncbi:MAG TPA: hypothetical protein VGU01_10410 [Sphingomicrobium sp.]|nr:hypothetical protein [Sphingomicrobium sp.]